MEISIITSLTDIESLRAQWENILTNNKEENFYFSFEWFHAATCFYRLPVTHPYIICFAENQQIIAIIPCCLNDKRLRFFTVRTLEIIGNIYSAHRGCIVQKGKEAEVAKAMVDFLLSNTSIWDMLYFEDMSPSDKFLNDLMKQFQQKKVLSMLSEKYPNLIMDFESVASSHDFWMKLSKNMRHNIRKFINKMNRVGSFNIVLTMHPNQDIETAMSHYYTIYRESWKRSEDDPDFHAKLARYLLPKGKLRLFILYFKLDNSNSTSKKSNQHFTSFESSVNVGQAIPENFIPIASCFYVINGKYAAFLKTAYREDHAEYSAGTVLNWFSAKWLLDVDKVELIDLQKGDYDYKFKWGRFKENHVCYQVANPMSFFAWLEIWNELKILPYLRRIKCFIKPLLRYETLPRFWTWF